MIALRLEHGRPGMQTTAAGQAAWPVGCVAEAPEVGVFIVETASRKAIRSDGLGVPADELLEAFAGVGAELLGEDWERSLARIAGIQARSIRKWIRNQTVPPARIVQWVGWARCQKAGFGRLCDAVALLPLTPGMTEAEIVETVLRGTMGVALARGG